MKIIKSLIKYFFDISESIGRARAAAVLARRGYYKAAQRLISEEV